MLDASHEASHAPNLSNSLFFLLRSTFSWDVDAEDDNDILDINNTDLRRALDLGTTTAAMAPVTGVRSCLMVSRDLTANTCVALLNYMLHKQHCYWLSLSTFQSL